MTNEENLKEIEDEFNRVHRLPTKMEAWLISRVKELTEVLTGLSSMVTKYAESGLIENYILDSNVTSHLSDLVDKAEACLTGSKA